MSAAFFRMNGSVFALSQELGLAIPAPCFPTFEPQPEAAWRGTGAGNTQQSRARGNDNFALERATKLPEIRAAANRETNFF